VLGESTADASDAGESDFEVLQGLPSNVAVVILQTLADQGNQPIGEPRQAAGSGGTEAALASNEPGASVPNTSGRQDMPSTIGISSIFGFLCLCPLVVIVFFGVGILLVVKSIGRR
jgi:hypothetical protein